MTKPHFTIKNKFQKRSDLYEDILTNGILQDVCERITGLADFTVEFDDSGYNIGRLATLEYGGCISYISFSEFEIKSRNSFFQSFPSALVRYHGEANPHKQIFFYFLQPDGNIETPYFVFMYRLMKTAGTIFLNEGDYLSRHVPEFNSISDLIAQRDSNRERNRGNASTYLTVNEDGRLQIFGKTYGANKYETALLSLAANKINTHRMELYEIKEGGLQLLPASVRALLINLGISVITSDKILEQQEFEANDSLRSPTYIYNLLEKLGEKKCSLCECEIPQIIQGAHIWPVASIKREAGIVIDDKIRFATDGDNGLWLCNNHHKLFDVNMLFITAEGRVKFDSDVESVHAEYLLDVTVSRNLPTEVLTPRFLDYLARRNDFLDEERYTFA